MADELRRAGKFYALNGIRPNIKRGVLVTNAESVLSTITLGGTEFEIGTLGESDDDRLQNVVNIDFPIASGQIGQTASAVLWYDGVGAGLGTIIARTDLETSQLLDTEGTFRLATGQATIRFL